MKLARVAVLGVALGAGVIAAVLAINMTSQEPAVTEVPVDGASSIEVLVAAKDIPIGSTLSADSVAWQEWPASGTNANFLVRADAPDAIEKVAGALARATLYAGEPIAEGKLIRSDRGYMAAILPAGKRAVATKIAADTSAGGFILPNDRVDVIMTRHVGEGDDYVTETILNDVRILAIDQTVEEVDGEKVVVGQTATLELTSEQAKILTVAQQMSDRLTLALRSIADAEHGPDGADAFHLIGGRTGGVTMIKNGVVKSVSGIK